MHTQSASTTPGRVQEALDRAISQLTLSRDRLRAGEIGEAEISSLESVREDLGSVLPELAALAGPESQTGLRARVIADRLDPELKDHLLVLVARCTGPRETNIIDTGDRSLRLHGVRQELCPAEDNAHICSLLSYLGLMERVDRAWAFYPVFRVTPIGFAVAGVLLGKGQQSSAAPSRSANTAEL